MNSKTSRFCEGEWRRKCKINTHPSSSRLFFAQKKAIYNLSLIFTYLYL